MKKNNIDKKNIAKEKIIEKNNELENTNETNLLKNDNENNNLNENLLTNFTPDSMDEILKDLEINRDYELENLMKINNFNNAQIKLVYELIKDYFVPLQNELEYIEYQLKEEKLHQHFEGKNNWNKLKPRINEWAKNNLNNETYNSLSKTVDGIVLIFNLMQSNTEKVKLIPSKNVTKTYDKSELLSMMRNPKYWKLKDKNFIKEVNLGFQKLYPNK